MKQTMSRLSVALLTFVVGVLAATVYLASHVPNVPHTAFEPRRVQTAPAVVHCFPGRSVWTQTMGRLSYFPQGAFLPTGGTTGFAPTGIRST